MANAIPSDARARGIQNDPSIKPIRTFKTDAEEAIKYGGVSKIQIAVAEEKKREAQAGQAPAEKRTSPALYVLLAFMAVIVLGGGWYYWFSTTQGGKASQAQSTPVSIDPIVQYSKASTALIKPGVDPLTQIAASLAQQNPIAGTVGAIAPMSSATSTNMMALSDVLSGTHIPDPLARSLTGEYMVGVYSSSNQSPFIIIKNNYYQNAYSGMLSWEKDMGSDLTPFISVSMPNVTGDDAIDGTFQDAVLENINARVLKDQSGQTLLAYGFADKDTIVITTNETALKYLFDQLLQVRTVQ